MDGFNSTSVIRLSPIHSLNSIDNYSKPDGKSSHGVPTAAMKKAYPEIDIAESSSTSSESRSGQHIMNPLQGFLRCLECPLTFKDNASLRQHFIETHGSTYGSKSTQAATAFTCYHCSQRFPCPTTLKVHQSEHVLPNVQQILNPPAFTFTPTTTTNRLLNITFACQNCPSTFTSRELLVDHANVHLLGHQCDNPSCQVVYSSSKKQQDKPRNTNPATPVNKPLRDSCILYAPSSSDKITKYPSNYNSSSNNSASTDPHSQLFSFDKDKMATTLKNKQTNSNLSPVKPIDERHAHIREHRLKDHHHEQSKNKLPQGNTTTAATDHPSNKIIKPVIVSTSSTRHTPTSPSIISSSGGSSATEPRIVNCNGKKRFQCKVCHKYLSSKLSHEEHSRVHTGEKPYRCVICVKSYAVKNTYRQHMASHKLGGSGINITNTTNNSGGIGSNGGGTTTTNTAGGRCPTENSHILLTNTSRTFPSSPSSTTNNFGIKDSSLKCLSCLTTFSSQDKLDYHTCSKKVTQHQMMSRSNNNRRSRPNSKSSEGRSINNNSSSKESGFRCKICGKTFARKEWRKKHYLSHAGESCFRCDICGSIFVDEQIYLIHAQDHFCPSEIKKSFTDCNICGKVFPGRDLYDRHSCRFAGVNSSG